MNKQLFAKVALIAVSSYAVAASAATSPATATFQVQLKVQKACSVIAGAGSKIDLGTQDSSAAALAGTSNISVTCSNKTPYFIGLAPVSTGDTTGAGTMLAQNASPVTGNTDAVPYQLRSATGTAGAVWGNTATSTTVGNGVQGTGSGVAQTIPVFVTVPSSNFTPDTYLDTVTVSVNF